MDEEMGCSKQQLTERFIELVEQIHLRMRSYGLEEWSDLELTMPQFRTLVGLSQGPQRMNEIASCLCITLSSATSLIDRLVNKGLVERLPDAEDRRVVVCRLTCLGEAEVQRFWRIGRRRITRVASLLTPEELQMVVRTMEMLAAAMERDRERDSGPVIPQGDEGRQTDDG